MKASYSFSMTLSVSVQEDQLTRYQHRRSWPLWQRSLWGHRWV